MTELKVDLGAPTPVYEQIRSQVAGLVAVGALAPGERLPASRDLARDLGIAVGTVQRAYRELEAAGVVTSRRRIGTVVAERATTAPSDVQDVRDDGVEPYPTGPMLDQVRDLVRQSRDRGMSDEELLAVVRGVQFERAHDGRVLPEGGQVLAR